MIRFIKWFFTKNEKPSMEEYVDIHSQLEELNDNYVRLLFEVRRLEEENTETNNVIRELMKSLEGVDARIDILASEWKREQNV